VSEVVGVSLTEVHLDAETPHLFFDENDLRGLKTKQSRRKTPLVGFALEAAKLAVKKAGNGPALLPRYAKENGNTNASAAVNARLAKWEIGTHGFRHAMTDLLRAAGCPADIRKAITGHATDGASENYGEGFALMQRAEWLTMNRPGFCGGQLV
jgi:integrase